MFIFLCITANIDSGGITIIFRQHNFSASHAIAGLFAIPVNSRPLEELIYTDLVLIPGYRRPSSGDFQMPTVTIKFQNSTIGIFDSLRPVIDAD